VTSASNIMSQKRFGGRDRRTQGSGCAVNRRTDLPVRARTGQWTPLAWRQAAVAVPPRPGSTALVLPGEWFRAKPSETSSSAVPEPPAGSGPNRC